MKRNVWLIIVPFKGFFCGSRLILLPYPGHDAVYLYHGAFVPAAFGFSRN
jgi:hypothetical protein